MTRVGFKASSQKCKESIKKHPFISDVMKQISVNISFLSIFDGTEYFIVCKDYFPKYLKQNIHTYVSSFQNLII